MGTTQSSNSSLNSVLSQLQYGEVQLMGCVTDGLIFHYYKFVDEGNLIMKLVWAYQLLYDIYLFSF